MSHLDEGTLHALLDGELAGTEVLEIEAHLDGCTACSARLRDAREFLGEADRLVGRVQFGRFSAGAGSPAVAAAASPSAAPERPVPPPRPSPREHEPWEDASPVLLIPDNPKPATGVGNWIRVIGWAAALILVVSGGYMAFTFSKGKPTDLASAPPRPAVATAESQAVASPAELNRADSAAVRTPPAAARAAPARTPPPPVRVAKAKPQAPEVASSSSPAATAGDTSTDENTDAREEAATQAAEQDAIRLQAARALTQLDRERRAGRAAAATAALDREELTRPAAVVAAPPPPTLEQRAQVYLRIGLDEANRQLGGPVHVIEGMSPVFMGLAPGRVAAGADTTRPVVRVVYQDPQGRTILLDQQRRATQSPTPVNGAAWTLGNIILGLRGEAPAEVLRALRSRVR